MVKICTKCKERANIKVNVLLYCNACFIKNLHSKISKAAAKITPKMSILVKLKNSRSSLALYKLLKIIFTHRNINNYSIRCASDEMKEYLIKIGEDSSFFVQEGCFSPSSQPFDLIIHEKSLETVLTESFKYLCKGQGKAAVDNIIQTEQIDKSNTNGCCDSQLTDNCQEPRILNLFKEIKEKEIAYFLYLEKINLNFKSKNGDKTENIIHKFLLEIDSANNLALFNVLNTFKKL